VANDKRKVCMSGVVVEQLTASIGAEVKDLGLKEVLADPALQADIRSALSQHLVLAFRDQFLDDETHIAAAGIFGDPLIPVFKQVAGITQPIDEISDSATKMPDRDGWHTDAPFMPQPPGVALLRALKVPATGGDTLWANMYAAYDALSPTMQEMLKDVRVKYPPQAGLVEYAARHLGEEMANRIRDAVGNGAEHPLVRTHPETARRALYFARGFAGSVAGLNDNETLALWPFLEGIAVSPNIQCRWRWHEGDVVIWDERATQHFGTADHRGQERLMRRVMVTGETPV